MSLMREHEQPLLVQQTGRFLTVDIHAHLHVSRAEAELRQAMPDLPRGLPFSCPASDAVNARMFQAIGSRLNAVAERLEDMDRLGIDVQAISPNPGQYYYFAAPELGLKTARLINDGIAAAVAHEPRRLVGIGTVPLQHPEFAIAEMRRAVRDCGMRGIEIGTNVAGRDLGEADFRPFFAAAEELGVLLFMHPLGFTQGDRLTRHYLNNVIGNPLESTIALSHLIFGGVLEAYPGLRLCVAHGGGYLPAYKGRMDHAFRAREDCREHISREPSSYLSQVWFDSLVFDKAQLAHLVKVFGPEKICMGSDYPFDMAEPDPVGFLADLNEEHRAAVLGGNAARLLRLTPDTGT